MKSNNLFSELDPLQPPFKNRIFGSDSEESIFKSPIRSKRLEDRLNLDEIDSVWCLGKANSIEHSRWPENEEKSVLRDDKAQENDDSIRAFNKRKSEIGEGTVKDFSGLRPNDRGGQFELGKQLNFDFKHLENFNFEGGVESPKRKPNDSFRAFVRKSKSKLSVHKRVESSRTLFGFGAMAKRVPFRPSINKSSNLVANPFGTFKLGKPQKKISPAAACHVNLNAIKKRNPDRQRQMRVMSTSRRRSAALFCEKESGISTGLRREDFVVAELVKGSRNKHTLINLTKLMERSPMPARKHQELVSFLNSSMRKIESSRKITSPEAASNQLSLKKRSAEQSGHFERLVKTEAKKPKPPAPKTAKKGKSKNPKTRKKNRKGCKCRKTNCTRLHCVCFQSKGYCTDACGCTNCFNRPEFSDTIKKIRDFTQDVNPLAFKSKIEVICLTSGQKIHNRGCSCTKNNCKKNYCECFKNGLACSPLCKCEGCLNEKVEMGVEDVKKVFKKCSRKKKKFQLFVNKRVPEIKQIQI